MCECEREWMEGGGKGRGRGRCAAHEYVCTFYVFHILWIAFDEGELFDRKLVAEKVGGARAFIPQRACACSYTCVLCSPYRNLLVSCASSIHSRITISLVPRLLAITMMRLARLCRCVYVCIYVQVYMYVCMYACMYVFTYTRYAISSPSSLILCLPPNLSPNLV